MGNHVAEVVEGLPAALTIKVHAQMCCGLLKLVTRVLKIFPELEAARPRCSSGIDALCSLNNGIVKAKSLLQHCSESSVLYLALTGDAILSRCKRSKNLLEESLNQIQNMVPVMLAAKISGITAELKSAFFRLDPSEEEAGKILRELLHKYGSTLNSSKEAALAATHTVCSRLRISSQKALLIEKRSIRKLLDKFGETEPSKKNILLFFLNLLNKYGKALTKEQMDNVSSQHENPIPFPFVNSTQVGPNLDSYKPNEARINILSRPQPPLEFICPLSSRLMYDPVVIASGQTYEKTWIQKWFDEGHDFCPKTNRKLVHFSSTSNTAMKNLIVKWCALHEVSNPNPEIQETLIKPWEISMNSIASLSNSMNDLNLPLDFSNVTIGSSNSYEVKPSCEIDMVFFSEFSTLPWDSRCNVLADVRRLLKHDDESLSVIPLEKFVRLIIRFLKDAREFRDTEAQMTGCLLLFEFVQKYGSSISYMNEDAYTLLASFLDTELSKQALSIMEILSFHKQCRHKIAQSGVLTGISNILDSQIQEFLEPSLQILSNLSSNGDNIGSFIVPSVLIPKIIPLLKDDNLSRHSIAILKNFCDDEEAKRSIVESEGCISSIAKFLEKDDHKEQEHAVAILLSLCSQRVEFCQLVMDEGVIPDLVCVSVNGNKKAKAMAMELLRNLKDEVNASAENSSADVIVESTQRGDKNLTKTSGLFGKLFSKPSGLSTKKKK